MINEQSAGKKFAESLSKLDVEQIEHSSKQAFIKYYKGTKNMFEVTH